MDTGCANIPGQVNADTWLSIDVPKMVTDNFRAQPAPRAGRWPGTRRAGTARSSWPWPHPDRYRAAVSMSGYNDPIAERNSLAAQTPARAPRTTPTCR